MKTTSKIIAGAAAALSLALAGAVLAHPGGGMGPGMGWGPGMGPGAGMGAGMGMGPGMGMGRGMGMGGFDMAAAAAGRLAALKTQLKITPAQESAWKTYEGVVTQQSAAMQAMRDEFHAKLQNTQPGTTAPEMAAQHQSMMALRASSAQANSAALKDLFAVLTPEQRAIADRGMGFMGAQRGPGRGYGR
jgi:periplasmic protein CpxP/Spy